jgi:uncharacterized protein (DUF1697 family)
MRTHLGLLRGVNVGGHNKLAMADLRAAVGAVGGTDVATYIQSGNVVFTSSHRAVRDVATALEEEIWQRAGVRCDVVVLLAPTLDEVVARNPFPAETDPKRLHAIFRREPLTRAHLKAVGDAQDRARSKGSRDQVTASGNCLYLRTPDGMGRSVLAAELARLPSAGVSTSRNWATVLKLQAMLGE